MNRTALLLLPGLLACGQPTVEDRVQDCLDTPGPGRDRCLAELADGLFETDPTTAVTVARQIGDVALRDVVLLAGNRAAALDLCHLLASRDLERSCRDARGRPHLAERPGSSPTATPSPPLLEGRARTLSAPCDTLPAGGRGPCLFKASQQAGDREVALALCAAITDPTTRGECHLRVAEADLAGAGGGTAAAETCGRIPDSTWRNECLFRSSENLPPDRVGDAAALCRTAGFYADECLTHLVGRVADRAARGQAGASFRDAIAHLDRVCAEVERVAASRDQSPDDLRLLFWLQAFQAWIVEAAAQGTLDRWHAAATLLPEGDPRRALLQDLVVLEWFRLHLQATVRAGGPDRAPGLPALLAAWQQVATAPAAALEPDRPPLLGPVSPTAGATDDALPLQRILSSSTPGTRFATGAAPWPLHPASGCDLPRSDRLAVVALWSLVPFPWEVGRPVLLDALSHPNRAVRLFALDTVAEVDTRQRGRSPTRPAWLLEAVARVTDPPEATTRALGHYLAGQGGFPSPDRFSVTSCRP